jgi:hypothetical protein
MNCWRLLADLALCIVCFAAFTGCDDTGGKKGVSGSVQFQGKPLDQGTISFYPPDSPKPAAEALITDGRYSIPADQGLLPGKYVVRLRSTEEFRITPDEYAAGKTAPPARERIAAKFNEKSQETAEVKTSGANAFDFQVEP